MSYKIKCSYHPKLWAPKTTLRFNDLLEGLTELRKVIIDLIVVHYSERIPIKISNDEKHTGEFRRDQAEASCCPCPLKSHEQGLILQQLHVKTHVKCCQPEEPA